MRNFFFKIAVKILRFIGNIVANIGGYKYSHIFFCDDETMWP